MMSYNLTFTLLKKAQQVLTQKYGLNLGKFRGLMSLPTSFGWGMKEGRSKASKQLLIFILAPTDVGERPREGRRGRGGIMDRPVGLKLGKGGERGMCGMVSRWLLRNFYVV